ncbi:MAG: helix-turn-helix domain-containing protein, partial [Candidatus Delongbacteria bacterium]
LETRAAIISMKADEIDLPIDNDVVMFIANNINTNVRDLEGAVKKLYFYHSHYNKEINITKAKEILKELITSQKTSLNIDKIQDIVSEYFSIPKDLLMKKTRTKEIAEARAVAMYLCTTQLKSTTTSIGIHFGGREHSTVSHAANKIQKKLNTKDPDTVKMIEGILNVINLSTC